MIPIVRLQDHELLVDEFEFVRKLVPRSSPPPGELAEEADRNSCLKGTRDLDSLDTPAGPLSGGHPISSPTFKSNRVLLRLIEALNLLEHIWHLFCGDQNSTRLGTFRRTDNSATLHQIHESSSLCKTDSKFALQH